MRYKFIGWAVSGTVPCPYSVADSDKTDELLSLDDDIIEFLYKSGAKLDLDYYILT